MDVSIILPIYNMEKFLKRSIQSVLNQTHKNIEIILVNDGSKDKSGLICDYYNEIDNRITVIHQKNAGSGYARNAGLEMSVGRYVYFMDPDDYIQNNLIEDNFKLAKTEDANLVVFGYYEEKNKNNIKSKIPNIKNLLTREDFKNGFLDFYNYGSYTVWNRLYKLEYLKENKCKFTNQSIGQDAVFNLDLFNSGIDKVFFNNKAYYHYVNREDSAVNKYHSKRYESQYKIAYKLEKLLNKIGIDRKDTRTIINSEYFNALYLELNNLTKKECTLSLKQKKLRLKKASDNLKVRQAMKELIIVDKVSLKFKIVIYLIKQKKYILTYFFYKIGKILKTKSNRLIKS